jgi:hypothetical protein
MAVLLLPILSLSLNVSIDLGSGFLKLSSPLNFLQIPCFVAFRSRTPFNSSISTPLTEDEAELLQVETGEKAAAAANIRPWMGTGYFPALAGLPDARVRSRSSALLIHPTAARLPRVDTAALLLKLAIDQFVKSELVERITLVFPAHFTPVQREIFTGAIEALNFGSCGDVDDVDAVAASYVAKNDGKAATVLFVDVGATVTKAYAVKFASDGSAVRLSYAANVECGGADVSVGLVGLLRAKAAVAKTSLAEDRRLFAAAEKAKIGLTDAKSIDVIVSDIGGLDRSATMTRSELESVVSSVLLPTVTAVIQNATSHLKIDAVELIGGSSLLPQIAESVEKVAPISTSLNRMMAIAEGGSLPPLRIIDTFQLFDVKANLGGDIKDICRPKHPCETSLVVPGFNPRMTLTYGNGCGLNVSQQFRIARNSYGNVTLHFRRRPFRFVAIEKCNDTCVPGRFILENPPVFNTFLISLFYDPDAKHHRLVRLRREVEDTTVRMLEEVSKNATIRAFTNHTQRLDIIRCAERHKSWIRMPEVQRFGETKNFSQHLGELKKCIAPVYRRMNDNETFWANSQKLYEMMVKGQNSVMKWRSRGEDGPDIFKFEQWLIKLEIWFNESMETNSQADLTINLPIKPKAFLDKLAEVNHNYNVLKNKYGSGVMPNLLRGDGSRPDSEHMKKLHDMPIMQKLRDFDWDDPTLDEPDDDL